MGRLHAQSQDNACGPACCAMVLDSVGQLGSLDESSLLDCLTEVDATGRIMWATPARVESYLRVALPGVTDPYHVIQASGQADLTHRVVWSLKSGGGPALVLTEGTAHWVAVFGYCVDQEPQGMDDTEYTVHGLFLRDPGAYSKGVSPHASPDACPARAVSDGWVSGGGWRSRIPLSPAGWIAVLRPGPMSQVPLQILTRLAQQPAGTIVAQCSREGNALAVLDGTEAGSRFPVSASAPGEPEYVLVERWREGRCVALIETRDGDDGEEIRAVAPVPPEHPFSGGIRVPRASDLKAKVDAGLWSKGIDLPAQVTIQPRLIRPLSGPARSRFAPQLEVKVGGGGFLDHLHHRALLDGPGFDEITLIE